MPRIDFLHFVFVLALSGAIAGCAGRVNDSNNDRAISILESPDADDAARAEAVASIQSPSAQDKQRLLEALTYEREDFGTAQGYVLEALIEHADAAVVHGLGELLLQKNNRYYAVALSIIGDEAATPYLRRAVRKSRYNFVRNNARQGLRILGDRSSLEHFPDSDNRFSPIKVSIQADAEQLMLGDQVTITVTYRNASEDRPVVIYPIWIDPFSAISLDGDHIERLPGPVYFFEITADSFLRLEPGDTYRRTETFELAVKPVLVDKWRPFKGKAYEMLCLQRLDPQEGHPSGGWVIARFLKDQSTTLQIAAIYEAEAYRYFVERFGIADFDYHTLVTPPVTIKCIPIQANTHD